jgi:hypothetical protein
MNELITKALELLSSAEGASATIAIVLEVVFRLFPSEKPIGVILMVSGIIKGVGNVLIKLSSLVDKVIPQKIK